MYSSLRLSKQCTANAKRVYKLRILQRRCLADSAGRNTLEYDVVIVGGGPAGLAFANALVSSQPVRESMRIALIEAGDLDRVRKWGMSENMYSNRVSSITNTSKKFLEESGAWKHVDESRTNPIEEMQVWDGISDSRIVFDAAQSAGLSDDGQSPRMARMTENLNLQRALLRSLDASGALDILDNAKVSHIQKDTDRGGWPVVHTSTGASLRARLLVGADGYNSPVRSYAGIQSYGWAYDTHAIVATLFHPPRLMGLQAPNTVAYQRFLPTGPIAFLPLSPSASSLVWSTKPALAAALSSRGADPNTLLHMINAAFRLPDVSIRYLHNMLFENKDESLSAERILKEILWRERSHTIDTHSAYSSCPPNAVGIPPSDAELLPPLVTSIQSGTVASFPLRMSHADSYIGEDERGSRTALLGDAAHTIHPLAGQGLNMGLMDAQALAECISSAILTGGDIGSRTALLPYARARYFENHKLLSATDKLHKLYASRLPPVVWARSVGLEVVNELDTLKSAMMMSAGATSGTFDKSHTRPGSTTSWTLAANGVEAAANFVDATALLGRAFRQAVSSGVSRLFDAQSQAKR